MIWGNFMNKWIERTLCVAISLLAAFMISGCDSMRSISVSSLADYVIVYPSEYSEWKMHEVSLLQNVLSEMMHTEIMAVPDTEIVNGKEIILASSSRDTKYTETVRNFDNAMCYIIGVDGENIVLGGQNYYSDMRAIYDFVNNILGYDDINDVHGEAETEIRNVKTVLWQKPEFYIMAANFASNPFTEAWQVKDVADGGFNLLHLPYGSTGYIEGASLRDELKYCARFGIEGLIMPTTKKNYNADKKEMFFENEEDIIENPAVFGMYVYDEPQPDKLGIAHDMLIAAKKKFGNLGWKFYIEVYSPWYPDHVLDRYEEPFEMLTNWREYFAECDGLSLDFYFQHYSNRNIAYCYVVEQYAKLAREMNQDFYFYTESYRFSVANLNPSKIFRTNSYLGLCFGAKMIQYFNYGDANAASYIKNSEYSVEYDHNTLVTTEFEKTKYYDYAKKNNEELKKVTDILAGYEYDGAYSVYYDRDNVLILEEQHPGKNLYAELMKNNDKLPILFGTYINNETNGKALLVMNMSELNSDTYEESMNESTITLRIFNGSDVKFYRNGELMDVERKEGRTYELPFGNGSCYLITGIE